MDNEFDIVELPFKSLMVITWLVPPKQGHVSCLNHVKVNQQSYHLKISPSEAVVSMSNPVAIHGCKSTNIGAWPAHH